VARPFSEGVTLGVQRYGGTKLDHSLRAANNTVRGAKVALEKFLSKKEARLAEIEAQEALLKATLKKAEAHLAKVKEEKAKKEPGTTTPGIKKDRFPGGISAEQWRQIRVAGKAEEYKEAVAKGKGQEWLKTFKPVKDALYDPGSVTTAPPAPPEKKKTT
jgi:hypothetical protein